jgi:hypothetical protein
MRALIHADIKVVGSKIRDTYLGVQYSLTPDAYLIVEQLQKESDVHSVVRYIARTQKLDISQARCYVYSLISQLNRIGVVRIRWRRTLSGYGWVRVGPWWRRRRQATFAGFFLSMLRAYGWLCVALTTPFIIASLWVESAWPKVCIVLPLLLFSTCIVHELGHLMAAKQHKVPVVLLTHFGYASVMYARPTIRVGRWIAAAGPLATVILCGFLGSLCSGVLTVALWGAGCLHLMSLLPWCEDGKATWRKR